MPAPNRCKLLDVPKLLDCGQRAVNLRLTKVNGQQEAGPVFVNQTPPLPGRSCDDPQTELKVPPLRILGPHWVVRTAMGTGMGDLERSFGGVPGDPTLALGGGACPTR